MHTAIHCEENLNHIIVADDGWGADLSAYTICEKQGSQNATNRKGGTVS